MEWYKKAYENGYNIGLLFIGDYYKSTDKQEAIDWYKKAANAGYSSAYISLGDLYKTINKQEAIYWYKKKMDHVYQESGKEDEEASARLNAMGVSYHPEEQVK